MTFPDAQSLVVTLALAFGGTTLMVFALVGIYLYLALERQVKSQDDLEIVRPHGIASVYRVDAPPAMVLTLLRYAVDFLTRACIQQHHGRAGEGSDGPGGGDLVRRSPAVCCRSEGSGY
ncbi:hypothetical protein [Paraburkholderia caffeinilytica]|uniref:hypothetical protein n=1 Tax=Paraburkholderia caffeinilytica TaxID=1761016 RepID=UPI0038BDAE47